jgi:ABC-type transport system involved in multi-copper enzyme maturation permease subunit
MSALNSAIGRLEAVGDHCNAIVVKEVRQALKSRQFVGTFVLLLMVAWGGSIFGVSMSGDSIEYGSSAQGFFILFYLILCVASLILVPFAAFRSIVEERAENTLELVQITALSPRQIIWGKSLSALVQVLVYFSAITPFIAFTSLLPGFDFVHTAFDLGTLLIASFVFSSVALAIGSQTKNKISQAFGSLAVIVLAIPGTIFFASFAFNANLTLDDPETWWIIGLFVFLALSTAFLCQQIGIAQLTFESDNRSSGIRVTVTVQWLVTWLAVLGTALFPSHGDISLLALVVLSAIYITVAGLFVTAEGEGLSRRVSRGIPRSRSMRMLWVPFLPGGTRGLIFGLTSLGLMTVLAVIAAAWGLGKGHHSDFDEMHTAGTIVAYGVIYLGVGAFLTRMFRRVMPNFSPGHLIAALLLITLLLVVFDVLWRFLSHSYGDDFQPIDIVNPFITYPAVSAHRTGSEIAGIEAAILAGLALAFNVRAMAQTTREVLHNPVRAQIELEAARRNEAPVVPPAGAALEAEAAAS